MTTDKYPPFRVDTDVLFGNEFHQRGHKIDWLMQAEDSNASNTTVDWKSWKVYLGATDLGERFINRLRKHYLNFRNDMRVFRLAANNSYQFIQVKDKFLGAMLGLYAARRNNLGFVYWLSYPFPEASLWAVKIGTARYPFLYRIRGHFFHFVLYRIIARQADHIIVQSEQMKRDMVAAGVPAEKMTPVLMGFLPEQPEKECATKPLPDSNQVEVVPGQMIYLGTLLKTRQLDFLIRVLAIVRETVPHATLLYVGPEELPGDEDVLRREAERLDLQDAVKILGRKPREEAFTHVRESAVCFSPFFPTPILNSTSPTKLIEYFSLRKPAVANSHPEQAQVLADSNGGICVEWDEHEFAAAAIKLIQNPDEAKAMGESGYAYVMKHRTYRAIANQLELDYQNILAEIKR